MASCQIKHNSWLPIAFSILLSVGILSAFILHYTRNEVYNFPQISQAAGNQPQSGVFCILLFLSAFAGYISIFIRFTLVRDMNHPVNRKVSAINAISLIVGAISLVGLILVAAFPLSSPPQNQSTDWVQVAIKPHHYGSRILFVGVNLYYVFQTILTIIHWKKEGIILACIRILVVILTISAYVVMRNAPYPRCENCPSWNNTVTQLCDEFTSKLIQKNSTIEIQGKIVNITEAEREFCKASDRYVETVSISELFLAIFLVIYFLTFSQEFHRISVSTTIKFEQTYLKSTHDLPVTTPL